MGGGAWWAAVHGVAKSRTRLSDFTFTLHFHALEKELATHSSVLAWRIPGTEKPGGLPSMGSHRVGHDWSDLAAAAMSQIVMSENCLMASSISTPTPFETFEFQQGIPILSSRTHSAHSLWRWDAGMVAGEGQSWAGHWTFRLSSCNYEMLFPLTLSSALPSHKRMQTRVFNGRKILYR